MDPLGLEPRASAYFASGIFHTLGCKGSDLPTDLRARYDECMKSANICFNGDDLPFTSVGPVVFESSYFSCTGSFSASDRQCVQIKCLGVALGGDPAADSPTATLLRLNPTCEAQVRT